MTKKNRVSISILALTATLGAVSGLVLHSLNPSEALAQSKPQADNACRGKILNSSQLDRLIRNTNSNYTQIEAELMNSLADSEKALQNFVRGSSEASVNADSDPYSDSKHVAKLLRLQNEILSRVQKSGRSPTPVEQEHLDSIAAELNNSKNGKAEKLSKAVNRAYRHLVYGGAQKSGLFSETTSLPSKNASEAYSREAKWIELKQATADQYKKLKNMYQLLPNSYALVDVLGHAGYPTYERPSSKFMTTLSQLKTLQEHFQCEDNFQSAVSLRQKRIAAQMRSETRNSQKERELKTCQAQLLEFEIARQEKQELLGRSLPAARDSLSESCKNAIDSEIAKMKLIEQSKAQNCEKLFDQLAPRIQTLNAKEQGQVAQCEKILGKELKSVIDSHLLLMTPADPAPESTEAPSAGSAAESVTPTAEGKAEAPAQYESPDDGILSRWMRL